MLDTWFSYLKMDYHGSYWEHRSQIEEYCERIKLLAYTQGHPLTTFLNVHLNSESLGSQEKKGGLAPSYFDRLL